MPLDFSVIPQIDKKIYKIINEYQKSKGQILTEDDLKCILFKKLHEIEELSELKQTQDLNIFASSIHSELSWFDDKNRLTIKPDLTILEPENLSILHGCFGYKVTLPSKQCNFYGKAILFELKFIRYKIGISKATFEKQILNDFNKINRLFNRLDTQGYPDEVFCYFIIINKTDRKCSEFDSFLAEYRNAKRFKIIYGSGNVAF